MKRTSIPQKSIRKRLFLASLAILAIGSVWADPREDAEAAYERKDYESVAKIVNPLAVEVERGHNTGFVEAHIIGQCVVQDYAEAAKSYLLTAQQGDPSAQNTLGYMYDTGQGVMKDYAEAAKWYGLAAQQGDASAQSNLGNMYAKGRGVVQDFVQALNWYRLSAQQGNAYAQLNLGYLYSKGQGVVQDYVKAHSWYHLSVANGIAGAVKNRDIVAKKMTPQQIADAQKLARDCQARQLKGCD